MRAAKRTWVPIQIFENSEFGAKDVAVALGYSNGRDAVRKHVDGEDKTTVAICDTGSNYKTNAVFINESGLYSLILGSKLESADKPNGAEAYSSGGDKPKGAKARSSEELK